MRKVVVTGGFGFIGSNTVLALNRRGIVPYVIDRWDVNDPKARNIKGLRFIRINEYDLCDVILFPTKPIIVCLGARVDTTEKMSEDMWYDNVETPLRLEKLASKFIYASSGAVYGAATDFTERLEGLIPMNDYGTTKYCLDTALFGDSRSRPYTYGLRFMNCYGEREAHKGNMASLVTKGLLKQKPLYAQDASIYNHYWALFESPTNEPITRDFIHVSDIVSIIMHFIDHDDIPSGLFNCGTGVGRPFEDLVRAVDSTLDIKYVPIPEALKSQYQSKTVSCVKRLREVAKYTTPFTSLEDGVEKTRAWMKEEGLI